MPKDYYLQPDAPDPVLTESTVLALVRRHAPGAANITGVDESGGEARTYLVDADLILKTQRPHKVRLRTSLAKEVLFLRQLEGVAGVSVPEIKGHGRSETGIEYTLMTRISGISMRHAQLTGDARRTALSALGRMLRNIHSIRQEPLRKSELFFGDLSGVGIRWRIGNLFDEAAQAIHATGPAWRYPLAPEEIGRRLVRALSDGGTIVPLHSNPGPEHAFVAPESGTLTGLIDFGDAYFSHPVNDLRRFRDPADRIAVLQGYLEAGPVHDGFWAYWRAACALADMSVIADSSAGRAAAEAELEEILREVG
jgi:hygromycin-B 7''-O-kinase